MTDERAIGTIRRVAAEFGFIMVCSIILMFSSVEILRLLGFLAGVTLMPGLITLLIIYVNKRGESDE